MRSRLAALTLLSYLVFALLACSSKPPAADPANATNGSDPANSDNGSASGGGAMAGNKMAAGAPDMAAPAPQPVVVPAGTVITVRLGETLSSKESQSRQTFTASVVSPVDADGKTVIPAGATATGTVVAAQAAGKFKGASLLQIKLDSITVAGHSRPIQTSSASRSEKGKGKRTATMIGGGAGAGALIGALAGGGKERRSVLLSAVEREQRALPSPAIAT